MTREQSVDKNAFFLLMMKGLILTSHFFQRLFSDDLVLSLSWVPLKSCSLSPSSLLNLFRGKDKFLVATAETKHRWAQLMAIGGDWEVPAWEAAEITVGIQWWEVTQKGTGSSTDTAGATNTIRKTLLCQRQTEETSSLHLFMHLHQLSRNLLQTEGRGE